MYKLFLCLRYLRSRVMAYFAMLGVTLCVAMMLIVVSVMNGFLDKIEQAAKGLFGDVVIEAAGQQGLGNYDELIAAIRKDVPEVEAASPFILSYGMIKVPHTDYRRAVQIAGIRLPERVHVSSFGKGLFVQAGVAEPTFDPPIDKLLSSGEEIRRFTLNIFKREYDALKSKQDKGAEGVEEARSLLDRLTTALQRQDQAISVLEAAKKAYPQMEALYKQMADLRAAGKEEDPPYAAAAEKLDKLVQETGFQMPDRRVIVGLGIQGLTHRTEQGETLRMMVPGHDLILYVFPLGKQLSTSEMSPNTARLTVADDSRTDVSSIDSEFIYVPFDTLQQLNNMHREGDLPARCSQIHVKVRGLPAEEGLERVAAKIREVWGPFSRAHPLAATTDVSVQTWRQRQVRVIAPIESQRTLVVVMFAIISTVAVVLVFVIFYAIVVQKTRDIGVLKAVGASSPGVAGIFLLYGAAVGLVGAVAGTALGYVFVLNINPIHDWVGRNLGLKVWSKEWFLFEKIPNEVNAVNALLIVIATIIAGLIGALVPAIRAARMQPVEALRYE